MNLTRYSLLLLTATLFACQKPAATEQTETLVEEVVPALSQAYLDSLAAIPTAIPESPEASRQPANLKVNPAKKTGLPFDMQMPEEVEVVQVGTAKWIVYNPDSTFCLFVVDDGSSIDTLRNQWKAGPGTFSWGQFLLDTPNGLLVEAVRNGKREYQVEYLNPVDETTYRIYSDQKRTFSRSQAERMFNACRMLGGGGR